MPTDSYLRLLPKPLAQAILDSSSAERHRFAAACAALAVDHCTRAVLGYDEEAEATLRRLAELAARAAGGGDAAAADGELAAHEAALYQRLSELRRDDAAADYKSYAQLATRRHTVRALRATLVVDGVSAAARAAFETISAMKFDDGVMHAARETLSWKS